MIELEGLISRLRNQLRKFYIFGRLSSMVPPESIMHDGTPTYEDFKINAGKGMKLFVEVAGLLPDEKILDIGSGIGRKTLFLPQYLSDHGSYDGLDIVKPGVDWCTRKVTSKFPNFHFHHIDIFNQHYNPTGIYRASEFRFPFKDGSFDLITMFSVFTHMMPADVENYLAETTRMLRPGGRSLITWFLLNTESTGLISTGKSAYPLTHEVGDNCCVFDPAVPERIVGYKESYVLATYKDVGPTIREPIRYGSWCGREGLPFFQDMIVADRL